LLALLTAEDVRLDAEAKTDAAALLARVEDACSRLHVLAGQTRTDASGFAEALNAAFEAVTGAGDDVPGATELRQWAGELVRPRDSRITSGFGNGREFNGEVQSRHMGTDFAGAVGAPVRAPARGVVALVDSFYLGGEVIYIDHGAGLVTGYLHLSRIDVAQGDTVQAGQVIGGVGATGRVTGPHLHWIVRYGTITLDPMSLLELEGRDPS
jgi:murein DD-endopeptidase MepM/ murein hydrolase activator NlpD